MPNTYKGRTILDHIRQIKLTSIRRDGFLVPGTVSNFRYSWNDHTGAICSEMHLSINIKATSGNMVISYSINNNSFRYAIQLITKKSNLPNVGFVWFMVCPLSDRLCRKLYFNGSHFVHRTLISGLYEVQTRSKTLRHLYNKYTDVFNSEELWQELNKKHAKKSYRGKITKRYQILLNRNSLVDSCVTPNKPLP